MSVQVIPGSTATPAPTTQQQTPASSPNPTPAPSSPGKVGVNDVFGGAPATTPAPKPTITPLTKRLVEQVQQPNTSAPAPTPNAQPGASQATPAPSTGLSSEQLQAVMTEAVKAGVQIQQQAAPVAAPAPIDQATIDKAIRRYRPTGDQISKIFGGGDEGVAALDEVLQGVVVQAFTMAKLYAENHVQQQFETINPQIQSVQQFIEEQRSQRFEQEFIKAKPELVQHRFVVEAVAKQMQANGYKPKTLAEAIQGISEESVKVLAGMGIQVQPSQGGGGQQQLAPTIIQPTKPSMSVLSSGGQGGSGGQLGSAESPYGVNAVFGKR